LPGKEEEAEAVQAAMDSLDLPKEQATA